MSEWEPLDFLRCENTAGDSPQVGGEVDANISSKKNEKDNKYLQEKK